MFSISEAQLLAWITPILWPFLRVLALLQTLPVLGTRPVPMRVRVGLAAMIALVAQAMLPPTAAVPLDSPTAMLLVVQQLIIGWAMGFAVRVVFAAVEFAGEVAGLQMGMNFAGFFDPILASQSTAVSRFFATLTAFMFLALNAHLVVIEAVVQSLIAFPPGPEPFAFIKAAQPHRWGAQIFELGLWIALPVIAMMLFINLVLGIVARVAPQANLFAIGFPITMGVGLIGLMLMLPMLPKPFNGALESLLRLFGA